jgi:hypothetical protein
VACVRVDPRVRTDAGTGPTQKELGERMRALRRHLAGVRRLAGPRAIERPATAPCPKRKKDVW